MIFYITSLTKVLSTNCMDKVLVMFSESSLLQLWFCYQHNSTWKVQTMPKAGKICLKVVYGAPWTRKNIALRESISENLKGRHTTIIWNPDTQIPIAIEKNLKAIKGLKSPEKSLQKFKISMCFSTITPMLVSDDFSMQLFLSILEFILVKSFWMTFSCSHMKFPILKNSMSIVG